RDAELARELAAFRRQPADRDRDEHQVVDAQHDLDRAQGQQQDPYLWIAQHLQHVIGFLFRPAYSQRGSSTRPHTSNTINMVTNTAADPVSLARPASTWCTEP